MTSKLKAAGQVRRALQMYATGLTDDEALEVSTLYPKWEELASQSAEAGARFTYGGKLYKVIQAHTFSAEWIPGSGTESLYAEINETNEGTLEDPIPYEGNMELTEGTYYSQGGVVYRCTRSTGQPVYHALSDLVGLYVEVAG